jgi:hypothetical protein
MNLKKAAHSRKSMNRTGISRQKLTLVLVLLCIAVIGGVASWHPFSRADASSPTIPITTIGTPDTSVEGPTGATLRTPSGLAITLISVEKGKSQWLLHFKIVNTSHGSISARGRDMIAPASTHVDQSALDRQFVLPIMSASRQVESRPLSLPNSAESVMHQGLPASLTLLGNGKADGWLAVDVSDVDPTMLSQAQVIYDYDPFASKACVNPADQSTCKPETLYHVLIWNIA